MGNIEFSFYTYRIGLSSLEIDPKIMIKVCVLMAVYNGEKFLKEQIDSILEQENVAIDIFCSLDSSSDKSMDILLDYASNNTLNILPYGDTFGGAGVNFYRLFRDVDLEPYDYVCLSDQDDIWNVDKTSSGIEELIGNGASGLSTDVIAIWPDNKEILIKKSYPQSELDHFFESPGPGCSFIFDCKLALSFKAFLQYHKNEELIDLHDCLLYAFSRSNGFLWHISSKPSLKYRQHAFNQCGANYGIKGIYSRLLIMRSGWYVQEVKKLFKLFKPDDSNYRLIKDNNIFSRIKLALNVSKFRRNKKHQALLALAILFKIF